MACHGSLGYFKILFKYSYKATRQFQVEEIRQSKRNDVILGLNAYKSKSLLSSRRLLCFLMLSMLQVESLLKFLSPRLLVTMLSWLVEPLKFLLSEITGDGHKLDQTHFSQFISHGKKSGALPSLPTTRLKVGRLYLFLYKLVKYPGSKMESALLLI